MSNLPSLKSEDLPHDLLLAIEQIHDRVIGGERINLEELTAKFPAHADAIREYAETMLAVASVNDPSDHSNRDPVRKKLGEFAVIREIGRGGMGVVYEAVQTSMQRKVALKVLPFAALVGDRSLKRFRNEVCAAAALDHPNIVSVHSFGEEQGVHYYAMQLISGTNLADVIRERRMLTKEAANLQVSSLPSGDDAQGRLDEALTRGGPAGNDQQSVPDSGAIPLSRRETVVLGKSSTAHSTAKRQFHLFAADLTRQAALALQHAHALGVIHRDIKPSNLLIDKQGKPWITDFGLAQIETDDGVTMTGDVIGTLKYMSPEQASGDCVGVDRRADIYSLGATFYELLTLRAPFNADNRKALLTKILQDEPTALRRLDATIPADLETICLKCLAKSPADRYFTAQDLADDLERFLTKKPIVARPPSFIDHLQKWSQRNRVTTCLAVSSAFALAILSTVAFAWSNSVNRRLSEETSRAEVNSRRAISALKQEQQAKAEAIAAQQTAARNLYLAKMRQAYADWQAGQVHRMFRTLEEFMPEPGGIDFRGWEWYFLMQLCHGHDQVFRGHMNYATDVGWHPTKPYLGSLGRDAVRIRNFETDKTERTFRHESGIRAVAWHPNGNSFAAVCWDEKLRIWNIESGQIEMTVNGVAGSNPQYSPDGTMLAWKAGNAHWKVMEVDSQQVIWDHQGEENSDGINQTFAWSPDSRQIACCCRTFEIWDIHGNECVLERSSAQDNASVAWSPDGALVAHGGFEQRIELYDASTGEWESVLDLDAAITSLSWSSDGRYLAIGTRQQIIVWDRYSRQIADRLLGHIDVVLSVAWKATENVLASASKDWTVRTWTVTDFHELDETDNPSVIVASPDERSVARIDSDFSAVTIGPTNEGRIQQRFPIDARRTSTCLIWSEDNQYIGCNDAYGRFHVWDAITGSTIGVFGDGDEADKARAAFAHDRPWVAVAFTAKDRQHAWVTIYDLLSGNVVSEFKPDQRHTAEIGGVSWSPDDRRLAVSGSDDKYNAVTSIWDVDSGAVLSVLHDPTNWVQPLAWHPDGVHVATGGFDGKIFIRNLETDSMVNVLEGHTSFLMSLSWSHDGHRLVSKSNAALRLWDPFEGIEILEIRKESPWFRATNAYFDGTRVRFDDPRVGDLEIDHGMAYANSPELAVDRAMYGNADLDASTIYLEPWASLPDADPFTLRLLTSLISMQIHKAVNEGEDVVPLIAKFERLWSKYAARPMLNGDEFGMTEFEQGSDRLVSLILQVWRPRAPAESCMRLLEMLEHVTTENLSLSPAARTRLLKKISSAREDIRKGEHDAVP